MNLLQRVERSEIRRKRVPTFKAGDTVKVHCRVREGDKERIQIYEGICIARKGAGLGETFTVRKLSSGIGVERVFPVQSPIVSKIQVVRRGKAARAKLYYLRDRVGKRAKVAELARASAAKEEARDAAMAEADEAEEEAMEADASEEEQTEKEG